MNVLNGKLLGFLLVLGLVVAGCGGAGSGAFAPSQNPVMGSVGLLIDGVGVTAESTTRAPRFLAAGVTGFNYQVKAGLAIVATGTVSLTSCTKPSPPPGGTTSYLCAIGVPFGGPYTVLLTILAGAIPVGTGTVSVSSIVQGVPTATISVQVAPVLTGGLAGPAITIPASAAPLVADGTMQTISATVNELDPLGNIIFTSGAPASSFVGYPTLTFGASDASVSGPKPLAAAPLTNAGTNVTFQYNGSDPAGAPPASISLTANDGTNTGHTGSIPVVTMVLSPNPMPSFGAFGVPVKVTIFEYSSTSTTFNAGFLPSATCPLSSTGTSSFYSIAPATATVTPPPASVPIGVAALTVTALTTTGSGATCQLVIAATDHPNLQRMLTLSLGQAPTSISIGDVKRRP